MHADRASVSRTRQRIALSYLLALLVATPAIGQSASAGGGAGPSVSVPTQTEDSTGQVVIRATRIAVPIRLDGHLDDAAYQEVAPITGFIQQEPAEGSPITEKTETWVMFDDTNIYFACRCWDEHPDRIVANDLRRDGARQTQNDTLAIVIDTFHDRRNGFFFGVSASGGMRDGQTTDERPNMNWNGIFDAKASRFERGWIAEMAVPFKSLRYAPGRDQTWGIQIRRFVASKNERAHLTRLSPAGGTTSINLMSQAATLVGIQAPPPALNFEAKPYAISRVTTDRLSDPVLENDVEPDIGLDVKYGVTKSLTFDATYNTDFAQVEADETQVNLTRFSLSYPEKREFFLEGAGTFAFGSSAGGGAGGGFDGGDAPTIFYSRRIGLSGSREVPVVAGARFSGRTGPWSIGAFNMETDKEPTTKTAQTNFTVLRLRHDILRRSNIGGIYTRRSVSTVAPGANDVWGLDANLAFYTNVYLAAYVAQSRTDGKQGDDLSYRGQFNYAADRYGLQLERLEVQPNFNPEVGFLRREDFRKNFAQARFSPRTVNNRLVRRWIYQGSLDYTTDNTNTLESRELNGQFRTEFHNSDVASIEHARFFEYVPQSFKISDVVIPVGGYHFQSTKVSFTAGQQHRVLTGSTSFDVGSFYNGNKKTVAVNGRVEISPQLGVEPIVSLNWIDLPQARFTTTVVSGRMIYTMSPQMFVAALVQYGSSNTSLLANFRFRWEYQPGSEFFVVYTEGRSTFPEHGTDLQSRGLVVKFNRLFRF